jgi:hypothetical protein
MTCTAQRDEMTGGLPHSAVVRGPKAAGKVNSTVNRGPLLAGQHRVPHTTLRGEQAVAPAQLLCYTNSALPSRVVGLGDFWLSKLLLC